MESLSQDELHQPILNSTQEVHDHPPVPRFSSGAHIVDTRLEQVLSDTELPWLKRHLSATWIELNLLFPLAGPAILVYLINNFMSTATRAFAGHLGNLALAAANLGNDGIQLFAYGLMVVTSKHHTHNITYSHIHKHI